MKLSEYARRNNIQYLAAYKMWQKGLLEGHRLPTGTIVIHELHAHGGRAGSDVERGGPIRPSLGERPKG